MVHSPTLHQQGKQSQNLKQTQRLIMSPKMQQAIHLLQAPILELAALIELELEQNPILEYQDDGKQPEDEELQRIEENGQEEPQQEDEIEKEVTFDDDDFQLLKQLSEEYSEHYGLADAPQIQQHDSEEEKRRLFLEASIVAKETLYHHLLRQLHETVNGANAKEAGELLIGNCDENGFLTTSIEEIAQTNAIAQETLEEVLALIQTFDPCGVGARTLQESLLIQLRSQGKEEGIAYAILSHHYEALLHNKIRTIAQQLHCSIDAVTKVIEEEITPLNLHPGLSFGSDWGHPIIPDLSIYEENGALVITIHDERIPTLRLNHKYMRMLDDTSLPNETREFIKEKALSAKWLLRNLYQRSDTLSRIANAITKRQTRFFTESNGPLTPMTMKMIAEELDLHESTVARAVANKYAESDRGLIALRSLFTNAYNTTDGKEISSSTVRDMLKVLINHEDKAHPLSDQALSDALKARGVACARRTVAKYRAEMHIGTAQQRRQYS